MKKRYDFIKLIRWLGISLFFIVVLNFAVSFYSASSASKVSMQLNNQNFSREVQVFENMLENIYRNMVSEIAYDTDLDTLEELQENLSRINITRRIKSTLVDWSSMYKIPINFVIYLPQSNTIINSCDKENQYDEWRLLEEELLKYVTEEGGHVGWCIKEMSGENYLIRVKRFNTRYIFCWTNLKHIPDSFDISNHAENSYLVISDFNSLVYLNLNKLEEDGILAEDLFQKNSSMDLLRGTILLNESVGEYFNIHMIVRDYKHIFMTVRVQVILGILLLFVVVMAVWFMWTIYRTLVEPIKQFTQNVDCLMEDENYTVATHYQMNELGKASTLLAELVARINGLKISIYEKTLEQQKIKMDFLTLQIQPHFYLNCLNIIYNMAQMGKYEEIQKLSKCVSAYLRYHFRSNENLVILREELEHTRNYLEIQEIRYRGKFRTNWDIEEDILEETVPPLILQTFVENTIKHAMNFEGDTELWIKGYKAEQEEGKKVILIVEDNGEGFEKTILQKLQNQENISYQGKQIGVMNVIQRMKLIYKEKGSISFYNKTEGGAGIKLSIPCQEGSLAT